MLTVNDKIEIPLRELDFTFARSSGPGGQNVNKVNTKATLRWDVTTSPSLADDVRDRFLRKYRRRVTNEGELVLSSQRFRDQGRNVADCLAKLRDLLLEVAEAPVKRKVSKPSLGAKRRRVENKRRQSQKKQRRRLPRFDD